MYCVIVYNILNNSNKFLIAKIAAILSLIKLINKKESLYTNVFNSKNLAFI